MDPESNYFLSSHIISHLDYGTSLPTGFPSFSNDPYSQNSNPDDSFKRRFLNLSTIDILDWIILSSEGLFCAL